MTNSDPSIVSSTITYIAGFILIAMVMNIVVLALMMFAGVGAESIGSVGWLAPVLAAMFAGQRYFKLAGTRPSNGHAWRASLVFLIVTVVMMVVLVVVIASFAGEQLSIPPLSDLINGPDAGVFFAIFGSVSVFLWLALRFSFSTGARQGSKQAERLSAKAKA